MLARSGLLRRDLDYDLLRAAMVVIFAWFGWDKWHVEEIRQLVPLITHGPLIFWTIPVLGIRGTSILLGASEWTFGLLLFLGFWNKRLGVLGALGSIATFIATFTIFPFAPGGWDDAAGGFPSMSSDGRLPAQGSRPAGRLLLSAQARRVARDRGPHVLTNLRCPTRGIARFTPRRLWQPEPARSRRPSDDRPLQHRRRRRPEGVLPIRRRPERAGRAAAARLPQRQPHVPRPDPGAGRRVSRRRPGPARLRHDRAARPRRLRLHLREHRQGDRPLHRGARPGTVRHLRLRLRRPGRLPPGAGASRAHHRDRLPERQHLPGRRVRGLRARSRPTGTSRARPTATPCAASWPRRPPCSSTPTA